MFSSPGSASGVRTVVRSAHGRRIACCGLFSLLLLTGCRGDAPRPPLDDAGRAQEPYAVSRSEAVPDWLGQPLSWEKLARIETWLAEDADGSTPQWRNEAELVLNAGRLEFARRELERDSSQKDTAQVATITPRVKGAKSAFERMLLRSDLNAGQRKRAQDGAARAEKLLARATSEKPATNLPVVARATWGAMAAKPALMDKNVDGYSRITVHHSADANPVALDGSAARTYEAARDIQRAHMNGKETHYGDIGYHFLIDPSGRVLEGRKLAYQGAHAKGDNNVRNVGVCLIGNFDEDKPAKAALDALRTLLEDLRRTYDIDRQMVYGHRDLRVTRCPGENLARWLTSYRGGPPRAVTVQAVSPRRPARSAR